MTATITPEKLTILKKTFSMFDQEKTGFVKIDMLNHIVYNLDLRVNESDLRRDIQEVDVQGLGKINFESFIKIMNKYMKDDDEEKDSPALLGELKEAFRLYDREGNGYISTATLREILKELDQHLSESDLDNMIEEIDEDASGTVDFDEFMEMMTG
ncbi:unnamed protein product [Meganyctiphanes norvegica]|uniref:EF-hand domain-containing protein n=1 Tax=Meganyctiphanes norvegica TaxID=48144 RepID=A0AAV2QBJ9_MEGNR